MSKGKWHQEKAKSSRRFGAFLFVCIYELVNERLSIIYLRCVCDVRKSVSLYHLLEEHYVPEQQMHQNECLLGYL